MDLTSVTENGKLMFAKSKFGRESRKSVLVNFYAGCTYVHIKNFKNDRCISLGIDEYEELTEILLDSLRKVDERFRKEDEEYNNHEENALHQLIKKKSLDDSEEDEDDDDDDDIIKSSYQGKKRNFIVLESDEEPKAGASEPKKGKTAKKGKAVKKV